MDNQNIQKAGDNAKQIGQIGEASSIDFGSITIEKNANGSAVISGNDNRVVIYQYQIQRQVEEDQSARVEEIGPNPYKGLLAFQETDGDHFFGRSEQIKQLWHKFRSLQESDSTIRLLPIYGPSGSGKSSLARAGLIPELARRPLPGYAQARVAVLVPGTHPLEALASVLARVATDDPTPIAKTREFAGELKQANQQGDYDGLRRIADLLPDIAFSPLIVLVDQFEEVYSLSENLAERDALIGNLLTGASDRSRRVSVIVTLRSDFLGETQKHPVLNRLFAEQGFLVPAMAEEELRQAIRQPAEIAGHPLDKATIELLIKDTEGREGALPLLQFALTRIWEGLAVGVAPATTLEKIGGVGGALAGEAQRVYDELTEKQKVIARRLFLGLIQLGEGTRDTRRRVQLDRLRAQQDDEADFRAVLNRFSAPGVRLITLAAVSEGKDTAEVTHEALFEHWQQLNAWLDQSRDDIRFQRRLQDAAQHWDNRARPEGLLWRPPDLDLLKSFHQQASHEMTPLELEFFRASVEAIERSERERKRQRQRTIIGLTGGLVGALGLAAIAGAGWWFATNAATNERIQTLVLESQSLFDLSGITENSRYAREFTSSPGSSVTKERQQEKEEDAKKKEIFFQEASLKAIKAGREMQQAIGVETETRFQVLELLRRIIATKEEPASFTLSECQPMKRGLISLTWTSDRKTIACVNYDGTVRLWDGITGKKTNIFQGETEWVDDVVFSPDGKTIASGTADGTVNLWNRATGTKIRELKGHLSQVQAIQFSPNGQTLAAANYDGTIVFWEVGTGRELKKLLGHSDENDPEIGMVFSPNGQFFASWSRATDSPIRLWEVATGKEIKTIRPKGSPSSNPSFIFSPDSQNFIYFDDEHNNQRVRFWSISGMKEIRNIPILGTAYFSPDGEVIAVIDSKDSNLRDTYKLSFSFTKGTVSLWDTSTGKKIKTLSNFPPGELAKISFSPDNSLIAVYIYDNKGGSNMGPVIGSKAKVIFWKRDGTRLKTLEQLGEIFQINFSRNGQKVAISSFGKPPEDAFHVILNLWDVATGRKLKTLIDEPIKFSPKGLSVGLGTQFSPDGKIIVAIHSSGIAKFFDSSTGTELNLANISPSRDISQRTSADEKVVITLRSDGSLRFRNRSTDEELRMNRYDSMMASAARISDDKTITTVNWYGKLQQRELTTGRILKSINLPFDKSASSLKFSPDGRKVAAARANYTVKIWDATTGKETLTLKEHATIANEANDWRRSKLHFSPNGKIIAVVRTKDDKEKSTLELWEVSTGKAIQFPEEISEIKSISFSPNGDELAILKSNDTIQLWKLSNRQLLKTIRPTLENMQGIQFSSESEFLFAFDYRGLKILNISTDREFASFKLPPALSNPSIDFSADGKTLILQSDNKFTFLNFDLEEILKRSCEITRDYLKNNPSVSENDKHICDSAF